MNRTCTWNKAVLGWIIRHEVHDGDWFQKYIIPNPTKFSTNNWVSEKRVCCTVYSQNDHLNRENDDKSMDFGLLLLTQTQDYAETCAGFAS